MRLAHAWLALLAAASLGAGEPALPGIAVVELFTSEGCSSCPPADLALAALAAEGLSGVHVLAYHVDYWDQLGWADPFALPGHTVLQRTRATAVRARGLYTPQAVVNGRWDAVGSDSTAARGLIDRARQIPATARLQATAHWTDGRALVTWQASGAGTRLVIAVVEDGLVSAVQRGENAGRRLTHARVVRASRELAITAGEHHQELALPADAQPDVLTCVLYALTADGAVCGATEAVTTR